MTQQALRELVELAEKAGAHEWAVDGDDRPGMEWNNFIVQADKRHMTVCFMAHAEGDNSELEAAAEFIAAAKNAIPHLKALLGEQREAQEPIAWMYMRHPTEQYPYGHGQTWSLIRRPELIGWIEVPLYSAPPLAESVGDGELKILDKLAVSWMERASRIKDYSGEGATRTCAEELAQALTGILKRRHMQQGK